MKRDDLEFYSHQRPMSEPGRYKALFDGLPKEPAALVAVIQGLALYDVVAGEFYGVDVPKARLAELHLRRIEQRIERLLELDPRPLEIVRPPERRAWGGATSSCCLWFRCCAPRACRRGRAAASANISTRQSSRTIGCANKCARETLVSCRPAVRPGVA